MGVTTEMRFLDVYFIVHRESSLCQLTLSASAQVNFSARNGLSIWCSHQNLTTKLNLSKFKMSVQ